MNLPSAVRTGSQEPRISKVPPYVTTSGHDVAELADVAGLHLDPWQRFTLIGGCGETALGTWSAFETAVIVPRQNGKGSIIEARELAGFFLFGSQMMIHSAHEFKTAAEGFRRVLTLIENTDELRRKVRSVTQAHGQEGIELLTGQRLRFMARTRGSGRGFSADDLFLDEAYNLSSASVAAMLPTLSARPNPQIWYLSSAPLIDSDQLRALQKRGRSEDAPRRLAYYEWSAVRTADLDDLEPRYQANPGMGIRLSPSFTDTERDAMDDVEFARERLGIEEDVTGSTILDMALWDLLGDPESRISGKMALAIDVNPERSAASIGVAGYRPDGKIHLEVIEYRPGTDWVVTRAAELNERHKPIAIVLDDKGPAGSLIPRLEAQGIAFGPVSNTSARTTPVKLGMITSASDMAKACGAWYDSIISPDGPYQSRYKPNPVLTTAVAGARWRDLGDARAFARKDLGVDISPLITVVLAAYALNVRSVKKKGAPPMVAYA
jgi:hypothetical protein